MMRKAEIYQSIEKRFPSEEIPDWHSEAIEWLRDGKDRGVFGLYLYFFIKNNDIKSVLDIGTGKGYSAICSANALKGGEVFTVDIKPPTHKHQKGKEEFSIEDLVKRFHNSETSITFLTGDQNKVLEHFNKEVDLVFHDGKHSYEKVSKDISLLEERQGTLPIMVFDDCPAFSPERLKEEGIEDTSKFFGNVNFWGVRKAVLEAFEDGNWERMEFIGCGDHAPVAALFP